MRCTSFSPLQEEQANRPSSLLFHLSLSFSLSLFLSLSLFFSLSVRVSGLSKHSLLQLFCADIMVCFGHEQTSKSFK